MDLNLQSHKTQNNKNNAGFRFLLWTSLRFTSNSSLLKQLKLNATFTEKSNLATLLVRLFFSTCFRSCVEKFQYMQSSELVFNSLVLKKLDRLLTEATFLNFFRDSWLLLHFLNLNVSKHEILTSLFKQSFQIALNQTCLLTGRYTLVRSYEFYTIKLTLAVRWMKKKVNLQLK